jgi:hypothetical protein
MNALLQGSVLFSRRAKNGSSGLGKELTGEQEEERRWMSLMYSQFCRDIVRQQWAVGFAAVTHLPHPKYTGYPVVLNLERCEIKYYTDVYGQTHFRFFELLDTPLFGIPGMGSRSAESFFVAIGDMNRRELPNVVVFVTDPPSVDAELRSKIIVLADDIVYEAHLKTCCYTANIHCANPPLVTEKHSIKPDSHTMNITDRADVRVIGPGGLISNRPSLYEGDGNKPGPLRTTQIQDLVDLSKEHAGDIREMMLGTSTDPSNLAALIPKRKTRIEQIPLEQDRIYKAHTLPIPPHDAFIAFSTRRLEKLFALFNVPLSMISSQSALGSKTGMTENAYVVFMAGQKELKQRLLQYIHYMYRIINDATNAIHYLMDSIKKKEKPSIKGVKEAIECDITMPGIPPEPVMNAIFLQGVLKFEAYKQFLHDKHAIPFDHFNNKLELSQQELNGLKPPDETDASGRKSGVRSA